MHLGTREAVRAKLTIINLYYVKVSGERLIKREERGLFWIDRIYKREREGEDKCESESQAPRDPFGDVVSAGWLKQF